ncbi:hypothetical protein [Natrinema salinisoli]|uniref:hypothetical protein n=1 Tax=Natrinema salinisoli TaxID=2878535 RepID=UPI001CF0959F|nr:hypothetical protein [Natrinema salinisoli]
MSLPLETLHPAVLGGGIDATDVVGAVLVVAIVVIIGVVVFLTFGPGTQPYQAESAEPTPTDDEGDRDADAEDRPDSRRGSESG